MSEEDKNPSSSISDSDPAPDKEDAEMADPLGDAVDPLSENSNTTNNGTKDAGASGSENEASASRSVTPDTSSRPVSEAKNEPVNGVSNGSHESDDDNDDLIIEEPEDPLAEVESRKRKLSENEDNGVPKKITLNGDRVIKPVVIELDGTQEIKQAIAQHAEKKKEKKKKSIDDSSFSSRAKAEEVATERRASLRQRTTPVKLVEPDSAEETESSEDEIPRDLPSVTITPAIPGGTTLDPLSIEPVRKGTITIKPSTKPAPALKQLPSVTITKTVPKTPQSRGSPATLGKQNPNDETTIVLVDTNSILQGKGPMPAKSSPSLPPALSALYKSLPPGLSINQSPGLTINQTSLQSPGLSITASPVSSKPPMVSLPMLMGGGVTITNPAMTAPLPPPVVEPPPVAKPPPPAPFVQSLLSIDESACVVEAPSFVAPYLIEKPGESIGKFLEKRQKELNDLEKKFNGEVASKEEKMEVEEKTNEKTEAESKEVTPPKTKGKAESPTKLGKKDEKKDEKETKDKKDDKKEDVIVEKSTSFFDSSIGKFFQEIGMNLVTEFVQNDFYTQQTRKARRLGMKNLSSDERLTIASLERALEKSKQTNEAFMMPLQKCPFCSFHTESNVVLAHHMETPHMMKFTYYCNFCQFDTREAAQILSHVEQDHTIKGRLEKAPMAHQCIVCPFEDNLKSKVNRHIVTCQKRFKAEDNLIPPLDWDPPAKVSKTAKSSFTNLKTPTPAATAAALNMLHPLMAKNQMLLATMQAHQAAQQQQALKKIQQKQQAVAAKGAFRSPGGQQVFLPSNMAALQGNQLFQISNGARQVTGSACGKFSLQFQPGGSVQVQGSSKSKVQTPSISITPLPKTGSPAGGSPGAMITKGGVTVSPVTTPPVGVRPGQPVVPGQKQSFVVCEICDGYIKDLEQLRNHMQWIHKVKIHPKMIHNRPPLNCQKCQFRFFTDQGLERHLLGTHGLVTSSMQEAANRGQDAGRCPVCGKVYQWRLLTHVARDHSMTLKPAHLSYKCTVCTATFGMYKQFENHVYSAHSNVAKRGDKAADSPKNVKSANKPLKINDEITIIPQPLKASASAQEKTDAVTSMLKKSGVEVIPKGSVSVEAVRRDPICEFCNARDNLDAVEIKGNKLNICKSCSKKLVNEDVVEQLRKKGGNVDVIDLDDDEDSNVSGRESISSRSGVSIIPVQKTAPAPVSVSATESDSSSEEEEPKPKEPAKIVAPNDDLDLD